MSKGERRRIRDRDGPLCCPHTGGCGTSVTLSNSNIDHIVPQSYCKSEGIPNHSGPWNKQLSHPRCNNQKAGRVSGIPLFTCLCHYFQVEADGHLYLNYGYESEPVVKILFRENFVQGSDSPSARAGQESLQIDFTVDDPSLPVDRRTFTVESTMSDKVKGPVEVGARGIRTPNADRAGWFFQRIDPQDAPLYNIYQRKPRSVHEGVGYEYPIVRNARSQCDLWHNEIRAMFPSYMVPVLDERR